MPLLSFPPPHAAGPDARAASALPCGVGPDSAACWEVDLSQARALIETVASGGAWPEWVAMLLHAARIVDVNDRGIELVGSPVGRDHMIGQPVACFCPPESWNTLAELIVEVASDSPGHGARSHPVRSFMLRDAVLAVWGAAGDAVSGRLWVAVKGEVADDRSFWAVRASEQRYRRLIHHLSGPLLQVDARPMGALFYRLRARGVTDLVAHLRDHPELIATSEQIVQVTDANRSAAMLFGVERAEELIGPVDFLFTATPDAARRVVLAHFEGARNYTEIMKLRTRAGALRDVRFSVTFPTPPERLDVTLICIDDITERLRTEAQLRQIEADYTRAARISMLGELATSIAHEVNQPLAAIVTNAETSLRWLSREEPNLAKVAQLTARIVESARHASDVVQRIRRAAARRAPERVLLDLDEVIAEALQFVRHEIESRAIELTVTRATGLPRVLGDRVQLQQLVVNLLLNAVQAQNGAPMGRIRLTLGREGEGMLIFAVHDSGPGIAAELLGSIFNSFFTTREDGIGIGLAICQSIVAAHGGTITAANHAGGGAVFRVSLPAADLG